MSTRFRCCQCSRLFGEREALCEDWSDPSKSFICPGCGSYLQRADQAGIRLIDGSPARHRRRRRTRLLTVLGAVFAGAMLMQALWGDRGALAVLLGGGAVLLLMLLSGDGTMPPEETVVVPAAAPWPRADGASDGSDRTIH